MLTTITNTTSEIMKLLSAIAIPYKTLEGNDSTIGVIYARRSSNDATEAEREQYPIAVLRDYIPELTNSFNQSDQRIFFGLHNYTTTDVGTPEEKTVADDVYEMEEPISYRFVYDLTFFVKDALQKYMVMDFMGTNYGKRGNMMLNAVTLPDGDIIGDPVEYNMVVTELERSDNVFQLNYEFSFEELLNNSLISEKAAIKNIDVDVFDVGI